MKTYLLKGGKSLLSIILAICLIVSVCSTGVSFIASADESTAGDGSVLYWDGNTEDASLDPLDPNNAENSEDNPYIIDSADDMVYLMKAGGTDLTGTNATEGNYYKVADGIEAIYFNDVANLDSAGIANINNFPKKTSYTNVFAGHFDGNGVTLYGVCSNATYAGGVFGRAAEGATIKNVNVKKSHIKSTDSAGGIIGATLNNDASVISIRNCSVTDSYINSSSRAAGIIAYAYNNSVKIIGCSVADNVISGTNKCAFIAAGWGASRSVSDSVCLGNDNLTAFAAVSLFANVYTDVSVSKDGVEVLAADADLNGDAAKTAMPKLTWDLGWQTNEGSYPTPIATDINYVVWGGGTDSTFATKDGGVMSETNPYIITSAEELYGMVSSHGKSGSFFKVSDDIDVFLLNPVYDKDAAGAKAYFADQNTTKKPWFNDGTGSFNGSFDGNGATIVGLYCYKGDASTTSQDIAVGFIPRVMATSATVKNIAFDKCYSYSATTDQWRYGAAGTVFGCVRNASTTATVENVQITNSAVATAGIAAGLVVGTFRAANGPTLSVTNLVTSENDITSTETYIGVFTGMNEAATLTARNCILADADIKATQGTSSSFASINLTNVYTASSSNAGTYNYKLNNTKGFALYQEIVYNIRNQGTTAVNLDWDNTFMVNDRDYPELKLFAYGGTAIDYAGGSGTETDPYLIANAVDLHRAMFAAEGTKHYELINDIEINPVKDIEFDPSNPTEGLATQWAGYQYGGYEGGTVGSASGYFAKDETILFTGTLDGKNHSIYGLYRAPNPYYDSDGLGGLTGKISTNGCFKNVAIRNSYINSTNRAAFFSTESAGTYTFVNVAVVDSAINTTGSTACTTGGFIGYNSGNLTFTNCLSDVVITAPNAVGRGAFVGGGNATYNNCVAKNHFFVNELATTIWTTADHSIKTSTYNNCLTDYNIVGKGSVTATPAGVEYLPSDATVKDEKMWLDTVYDSDDDTTNNTYFYDTYLSKETWGVDGGINPEDFIKQNYPVWSGDATAIEKLDGEGTEEKPYILKTAEDVYRMVLNKGCNASKQPSYWEIADGVTELYFNPIKGKIAAEAQAYLASPANSWNPDTNDFYGHFDGNGVTLIGLANTVSNSKSVGFIPQISAGTATIKDVTFDRCYFQTSGNNNWYVGSGVVVGGAASDNNASTINIEKVVVKDCYSANLGTGTATAPNGNAAAVVGGMRSNDTLNVTDVLTHGNTVVGAAGQIASILGQIYSSTVDLRITVNLENVVSADPYNFVSWGTRHYSGVQEEKLTGGVGYYDHTYTNVYAAYLPGDAANYAGVTQVATASTKGPKVVDTMPNLPWYKGWIPATDADGYPYFGDLGYDLWNGESVEKFESGTGTAEDPFIIANAEQLHKMVEDLGKKEDGTAAYYEVKKGVTALYLNRVDMENPLDYIKTYGENWMTGLTYDTGSTTNGNTFVGKFNGNGATIYGLYAYSSSTNSVGFIPSYGVGAQVSNVSFKSAYVKNDVSSGHEGAAVVAGRGYHGAADITISKVRVEDSFVSGGYAGAAFVGNARGNSVTISTCFVANNNISGGTYTSGVVAEYWGKVSVSDSVFLGIHPASTRSTGGTYSNVYTDTQHVSGNTVSGVAVNTAGTYTGADAETTMSNLTWGVNWKTAEGYPEFMTLGYAYWNGTATYDWEGKGTESNPYIIETAEQLYGMVQNNGMVDGKAAYFKVSDEVMKPAAEGGNDGALYLNPIKDKSLKEAQEYMASRGTNWSQGINSNDKALQYTFVGKFDGNGVKLIGMHSKTTFTATNNCGVGFVSLLGDGAVIKNVHFDKPYVITSGRSAAVITTNVSGEQQTAASIANVVVTDAYVANTDTTNSYAGVAGIVYTHNSPWSLTVSNCLFEGKLVNNSSDSDNVGGIASLPWGSGIVINGCVSIGYAPAGNLGVGSTVSNTYTTVASTTSGVIANTAVENLTKTGAPLLNWAMWKEAAFTTDSGLTLPMPLNTDSWEIADWNIAGALDNKVTTATTETTITDYSIFDGGNGTADKPYGISTGEQLYKAIITGGQLYGSVLHFKLVDDIDLGGASWMTSEAVSYTEFIGVLNGDGHTVYGLNSATTVEDAYAGLIPVVGNGAKVSNLHIVGAYVNGANAGGIIGSVVDGATVTLSSVSVEEGNINGTTAGGIIGSANATTTITDVYYTGTVPTSNAIIGAGEATVTNGYTTLASVGTVTYTNFTPNATAGSVKASDLGAAWYQGDSATHLPRLKSWAAAQSALDIDGDGEAVGYNAEDLKAMRSKLLYRSAYSSIYGDITYDGDYDIRDLMILKRSAVGSYADIDEGFWPNLAQGEYTIVYGEPDNNDAAYELQRYFAEVAGVEVPVVDATELETYDGKQIIALGVVSALKLNANDYHGFYLNMDKHNEDNNYTLWFNSRYVSGVEELVDLFKEYAVFGDNLPVIKGSFGETGSVTITVGDNVTTLGEGTGYKPYKQAKVSLFNSGEDYVYVWGDEFEDNIPTTGEKSPVSDLNTEYEPEYYYNFNKWRLGSSLDYADDIAPAKPEYIKHLNYVSNGKLVMRNRTELSDWTAKGSSIYATGGTLDTKDSMLFKRGYAELEVLLPQEENVFPAWWLMSQYENYNTGVDMSLYSKVYEHNAGFDMSSKPIDPASPKTFKYKMPVDTIEFDIFEVMYDDSDLDYYMTIHKIYRNTYRNGKIYDPFNYYQTSSTLTQSADITNFIKTQDSYKTGDESEKATGNIEGQYYRYGYNQKSISGTQIKREWRTISFLWNKNQITVWDDAVSTSKTITFQGNDAKNFENYMYFILDNHFYSPAETWSNHVPTQPMVIDSIRLYQVAGERMIITPDSRNLCPACQAEEDGVCAIGKHEFK